MVGAPCGRMRRGTAKPMGFYRLLSAFIGFLIGIYRLLIGFPIGIRVGIDRLSSSKIVRRGWGRHVEPVETCGVKPDVSARKLRTSAVPRSPCPDTGRTSSGHRPDIPWALPGHRPDISLARPGRGLDATSAGRPWAARRSPAGSGRKADRRAGRRKHWDTATRAPEGATSKMNEGTKGQLSRSGPGMSRTK